MSVDEGLLHAWIDGQLPPDETARVERLVAEDPEWSAAAAEARGLLAGASRVLAALDAAPSAAPVPVPVRRGGSVRRVPMWLRVAAGIVLVVGVGSVVWERTPRPLEESVPAVVEAPEPVVLVDSMPVVAAREKVEPVAPSVAAPPVAAPVAAPPVAAPPAAAPAMAARSLAVVQSAERVARADVGSAICVQRMGAPGADADTTRLRVTVWELAPDSTVRAAWEEREGRVDFNGRLHGDTLRGSSTVGAEALRRPPRSDSLLRVPCG